jgi:hypothetical protein
LSSGVSATALTKGWRLVGWCTAGLGGAAVVLGASGFVLNRWTGASAVAVAWSVAGTFGTLRLMTAGVRAQSFRRAISTVLACFAAPWAVAAVVAVAAGSAVHGLSQAVIPGVVIYVGVWPIVRGLLAAFGAFYEEDPEPATTGPAVSTALSGTALIAAGAAIAQGLAGVLVQAVGASHETRDIVGSCLGLGPLLLGLLLILVWRALPRDEAMASFGAVFRVLVAAKSAALFLFPALIAPEYLLIAGLAWVAAALLARWRSKPAITLAHDLA